MKEQFDKGLRDHIKDTFDTFDDGLAHDGWLHYQKKIRNKKRRIVLLWSLPTGMAASLIFLLFFKPAHVEKDQQLISAIKEGAILRPEISKLQQLPPSSEEKPANRFNEKTHSSFSSIVDNTQEKVKSSIQTNPIAELPNTAIVKVPVYKSEIDFIYEDLLPSTGKDSLDILPIEIKPVQHFTVEPTKNLIEEKTHKEIFSDILSQTPDYLSYKGSNNNSSYLGKQLRNIKLSLDASTYMNFSNAGMNDEVNIAVGLISEYQVAKNISINSGININRQTSSFTHEAPPVNQDNVAKAMSLTNSLASVINGHFTNARLVGLDIPLNIKYSTFNKKVNWFVSSGISSYALINEKYFNSFSVTNFAVSGVETSKVSTVEEHIENPISSFQLARSLNFSLGVSFPVKGLTTFSVEPFIKYPLKQFGQQNLSLGSGGVSLKMQLNKRLFKN